MSLSPCFTEEGNQDTNELGDFTCQIFTRQEPPLFGGKEIGKDGMRKMMKSC